MISHLDLWRAANILIERYGTEAAFVAAQHADEMLATGDVEGELVWKRVLAAINELHRTKVAANERRR